MCPARRCFELCTYKHAQAWAMALGMRECVIIWGFPYMVVPNGWFIMENIIKSDDLGVPLFQETLSWKKRTAHVQLERHPTHFKKSKSEKSKSILFEFSIFRNSKRSLFTFQLFEIENDTVPLFDFLTFWLFQIDNEAFSLFNFLLFEFSCDLFDF